MADPLTDVAERYAPAPVRTNLLDPSFGQSILGRYGQARAAAEDTILASKLQDAQMRNQFRQEQREEGRRRMELAEEQRRHQIRAWDREDEEHAAKKQLEGQLGQLAAGIYGLDHEADDFDDVAGKALASLPPGAIDNQALKVAWNFKQGLANEARARKDKLAEVDRRAAAFAESMDRKDADKALWQGYPGDRIKQFTGPDGRVDNAALIQDFAKWKAQTDAEKEAAKLAARTAAKAAAPRTQAQMDAIIKQRMETMVKSPDNPAFPNRVEELYKQAHQSLMDQVEGEEAKKAVKRPADKAALLKVKGITPQMYQEAEEWEKKRYIGELDAARNMGREQFMAKWAKGNQAAQEDREAFWRFANGVLSPEQSAKFAEPIGEEAPAVPPVTPGAPVPGQQPVIPAAAPAAPQAAAAAAAVAGQPAPAAPAAPVLAPFERNGVMYFPQPDGRLLRKKIVK